MMTKCPRCNKRQAIIHPRFGVTHCAKCKQQDTPIKEASRFATPTQANRIQEQQDHDLGGIAQPWNPDGTPNTTFIKANGADALDYFSEEELKQL